MRSMLAFSAAAALGLLSPPAAAQRTAGRVEYATAGHLYLDAGSREDLAPGTVLQIRRGEKAVSSCRVEVVSETHATCVGNGRSGDTFPFQDRPGSAAATPQRRSGPLPDVEIIRRRRVLDNAAQEKVDFQAAPRPTLLSGRTEVRLSYFTWASETGPWNQERLDAAVRGAPVGGGFALYADLSARRWTARSGPVVARPDDPFQLYVWEAELVRRPAQEGLALALGRIRPWVAPGATIVDGAQAGWRTKGNLEFGIFGGAVPDPATTAPSFDRSTAGGYLAFQTIGGVRSMLRYAREEVRIAYVNSPELGKRLELEGLGQMSLGRMLDVGVQGRIARPDSGSTLLDAFSADLGFRPLESLSFVGAFRYLGSPVPESDGPGVINYGGETGHADATARWDVVPWFSLGATSGIAEDFTTRVWRRYAGPELGFPRLFGDVGGASGGYLFEEGWSGGQTAWVQVLTRRPRGVQVMLRVFWYRTQSLGPYTADELGAYASVSAQLGEFISLRLSGLGRAGGAPGIQPFSSAGSLFAGTFDIALAGRF
jgi:hypothetical protein